MTARSRFTQAGMMVTLLAGCVFGGGSLRADAVPGAPPDCAALFPGSIPSSAFDGFNGYRIAGTSAAGGFGYSVAQGDVNGDGLADVIVGAFNGQTAAGVRTGVVYVMFGRPGVGGPADFNVGQLTGADGFVIEGQEEFSWFGLSVASGDVNGDSIDDVVIGAPLAVEEKGRCHVVFGGANVGVTGTVNAGALDGIDGFVIEGRWVGEFAGWSVAIAGDVNADGISDIIIGAPYTYGSAAWAPSGSAYLVFGRGEFSWSPLLSLWNLDGVNGSRLPGLDGWDLAGFVVAGAGDANGDGIDDVLIGAPYASQLRGETIVIFGSAESWPDVFFTYGLHPYYGGNGSQGVIIAGPDLSDQTGWNVSAAGDINADGADDFLIGAGFAQSPGPAPNSEAYLVFGRESSHLWPAAFNLSTLDGGNGFAIEGTTAIDQFGYSVSAAGDMNADEIADFVIGAPAAAGAAGGENEGIAQVIFGRAAPWPARLEFDSRSFLAGLAPWEGLILGVHAHDGIGTAVAGIGDVNADGVNDMVVGAPGVIDEAGEPVGSVVVAFGRRDCDDNGTNDACDLHDGTDTDCNVNTFLDMCDISTGISEDANKNGLPDECEPSIPTLSAWGGLIFAQLLLAAGTVVFRRSFALHSINGRACLGFAKTPSTLSKGNGAEFPMAS